MAIPEGKSTPNSKLLSSPKFLSKFAPVSFMVKNCSGTPEKISCINKEQEEEFNVQVVRLANTVKKPISVSQKEFSTNNGYIRSPSLYLKDLSNESSGVQIYCECGNICEGSKTQCDVCLKPTNTVDYSGHLYVDKSGKFKRYWYHLVNKELFCKKNKTNILKVMKLKEMLNIKNYTL